MMMVDDFENDFGLDGIHPRGTQGRVRHVEDIVRAVRRMVESA